MSTYMDFFRYEQKLKSREVSPIFLIYLWTLNNDSGNTLGLSGCQDII